MAKINYKIFNRGGVVEEPRSLKQFRARSNRLFNLELIGNHKADMAIRTTVYEGNSNRTFVTYHGSIDSARRTAANAKKNGAFLVTISAEIWPYRVKESRYSF